MKNNKEILSSLVRTASMGSTGLNAVLRAELSQKQREILEQQKKEYEDLQEQALQLAAGRGWNLKAPNSSLQHMIEHMTYWKLPKKDPGSKIADMVIQGNTQGMISSIRDFNHYHGKDRQVVDLNRQLIGCETEFIRQMKPFL